MSKKKKDFPEYLPVMFYFSNKNKIKSDNFNIDYNDCCGVLLYTENNTFFFNPYKGSYNLPDHTQSEMVPYAWFSENAIHWVIKNQPFDDKDKWLISTSMYSKDMFINIVQDIRNFKLDLIIEINNKYATLSKGNRQKIF
jgi:hypothetical protein